MKKTLASISFVAAALLGFTGCVSGSYNAATGQSVATLELTENEQVQLATEIVDSIMEKVNKGLIFQNDGSTYVLSIGSVVNNTRNIRNMEGFENEVREQLGERLDNRVVITDSIRLDGNTDKVQNLMDDVREDDHFDQNLVIKKGGLAGATHSLRTTLDENIVPLNGSKVEITYKLNMRINELAHGLTQWSKTTRITKIGSKKDLRY